VSPKPHSNLNLADPRTFLGRYTTIAVRINIVSEVDPSLHGKPEAPGAFSRAMFAWPGFRFALSVPVNPRRSQVETLGITCKSPLSPQWARIHAEKPFDLGQSPFIPDLRCDLRPLY